MKKHINIRPTFQGIEIYGIVNGNYESKHYIGYSRKEAIESWLAFVEEQETHEYIDAEDGSGFLTCSKGEII